MVNSEQDFFVIPNAPPAEAPSFASLFAEAVFSRTSSFFQSKVTVDPKLAEHPATQVAYAALNQLLNTEGRFFSGAVVDEYLQVLKNEYKERFCYSNKGIIHLPDQEITPVQIAQELYATASDRPELTDLAIAYDNKGHHIVIYIHRPSKTVEYYDPQGNTSASSQTKRGLEVSMREQVESIASLFFGKTGVLVENTNCHQTCLWRCAIWGLYYIEHRLLNRSAEELQAGNLSNETMDLYRKHTMAKKIEQSALSRLATVTTSNIELLLDD